MCVCFINFMVIFEVATCYALMHIVTFTRLRAVTQNHACFMALFSRQGKMLVPQTTDVRICA